MVIYFLKLALSGLYALAKYLKSPTGGPPLGGTARWLVLLEANYFFLRISACSAWICLLIDAINATIDFRTSALVTAEELDLIE